MKFSNEGGGDVVLTAKCTPVPLDSDNNNNSNGDGAANRVNLLFSVTDQGIGISPEAKENIFKPFNQVSISISIPKSIYLSILSFQYI